MLANQDIKYVVCASVLSVRAKSEIVCTDSEEHFTIQSDSICVQHVDSVLYTRGQHSESVTESVLSVRADSVSDRDEISQWERDRERESQRDRELIHVLAHKNNFHGLAHEAHLCFMG